MLVLVHLRYRSMLTVAGAPWRRLSDHRSDGDLGEAFAAAFRDHDWRYESALQLPARMHPGELALAIDHLDALLGTRTDDLGDVRKAHAEVFEALLRLAPRSQTRSWEASTTPSDVARLMVRSCPDDVGDVIDPAVSLGSALLEAHASGARRLVGWDVNGSILDLLRIRADLAGADDGKASMDLVWLRVAERLMRRQRDPRSRCRASAKMNAR